MNKEYKLLEIDGQTLYVCEELYNKIQKCDEQDKEIERLNNIIEGQQIEIKKSWKEINKYKNIINELEKWLNYEIYCNFNKEMTKGYQDTLDKLKKLKEGK